MGTLRSKPGGSGAHFIRSACSDVPAIETPQSALRRLTAAEAPQVCNSGAPESRAFARIPLLLPAVQLGPSSSRKSMTE